MPQVLVSKGKRKPELGAFVNNFFLQLSWMHVKEYLLVQIQHELEHHTGTDLPDDTI